MARRYIFHLLLVVEMALLCSCATIVEPELPVLQGHAGEVKYKILDVSPTRSRHIANYLMANYAGAFSDSPPCLGLRLSIKVLVRDKPDFAEVLFGTMSLGLLKHEVSASVRCEAIVINENGDPLNTLSGFGRGSISAHGLPFLLGAASDNSLAMADAVNRAECIAAGNVMYTIIREEQKFRDSAKKRDLQSKSDVSVNDASVIDYKGERFTMAVMNLDGFNVSRDLVGIITENIRAKIVEADYFSVISKQDMGVILSEAYGNDAPDQCVDATCLIERGRVLRAQKIVGGTVAQYNDLINVTLRLIDVETGRIDAAVVDEYDPGTSVMNFSRHVAFLLCNQFSTSSEEGFRLNNVD